MLISVVIIAKNEASNIAACIESAGLISDDIIVVDSGSNDGTQEIALKANALVHIISWQGYGNSRNAGAAQAKHDWIFGLDADERICKRLANAIKEIDNSEPHIIYGCKRRNYYGNKVLQYGEWGNDTTYRLYNKNCAHWDNAMVHESLIAEGIEKKLLPGSLEHYTINNLQEFRVKLEQYAKLQARNFYEQGKRAGFLKRFFSPAVNFLSGYIFKLGFLDGYAGFEIAKMNAHYTWLKYNLLYNMYKG
jgi:glycosyltransferase involved in cell wall biosynthesis